MAVRRDSLYIGMGRDTDFATSPSAYERGREMTPGQIAFCAAVTICTAEIATSLGWGYVAVFTGLLAFGLAAISRCFIQKGS